MRGPNPIAEILDVIVNGRREKTPEKPKVTIDSLIAKGTSCVLFGGDLYEVVVTKLDHSTLKQSNGGSR